MSPSRHVEELHLLRCSLLPDETLGFLDNKEVWESALNKYQETGDVENPENITKEACRFAIRVERSPVWFQFELPNDYPELSNPIINVKGDTLGRAEQERWLHIIKEHLDELQGSELLVYNLLSTHLLPHLHESVTLQEVPSTDLNPTLTASQAPEPAYHALLTSHHLISPIKRRSLQKWSSDLSLCGFAKVGYPGAIYCEGAASDVEEFVSNVKAMQWLALRVRFVEPLDDRAATLSSLMHAESQWIELEKVGEVVDYMRRAGREQFVVEMGLGSASSGTPGTT